MIIYLAGPIDFNKDSDVNEHRYQLHRYLGGMKGVWLYDPSKAWSGLGQPDPYVHWANLQVLEQADLLVAILMRNVLTVGTVLEIQHATERGIPVLVVGDVGDDSISLAALDVTVLESAAEIDPDFIEMIKNERLRCLSEEEDECE